MYCSVSSTKYRAKHGICNVLHYKQCKIQNEAGNMQCAAMCCNVLQCKQFEIQSKAWNMLQCEQCKIQNKAWNIHCVAIEQRMIQNSAWIM